MWKKYRGSFLSFILIIGLVLSGLSMPSYVSAAPPATDNVTNTPAFYPTAWYFSKMDRKSRRLVIIK